MLCEGVAIARTGVQIYNEFEITDDDGKPGLKGDHSGMILVSRSPEHVFRPETIASFNGKSVTIDHPDSFVAPENWKTLTVGTVHNTRRGTGIEDDLLIADLLVTDPVAIKLINDELPEVSAGYDAEYLQDSPGRAEQTLITGNHVALLSNGGRGRAGHRCAVKDSTSEVSLFMKIRDMLFGAKDQAAVNAVLDTEAPAIPSTAAVAPPSTLVVQTSDASSGEVLKLLKSMDAKLTAVTADVEMLKKGETKDDDEEEEETESTGVTDGDGNDLTQAKAATKVDMGKIYGVGDARSAYNSRAEILAPGIVLPTADKVTSSAVTDFFRTALVRAHARDEACKKAVETFLNGRKIQALTGDALLAAFNGSAALIGATNSAAAAPGALRAADSSRAPTIADLNAAAAKFWKEQNGSLINS
jgi:uncharacterized protein